MNIDSILTEWRYRLPAGYPKSAQDFEILRDVIVEMTDIDLSEAERIVRRSMGLNEAPAESDIKSMYSNRVIRIVNDNGVTVYSLQPFDDHDFDIPDAAQNKISGVDLSAEELSNIIKPNATYNFYMFDKSYKLVNTGETMGQLILNSVSSNTQDFIDAASFEKFILERYSVPGQEIIGIPAMYSAITRDPQYAPYEMELLDLIRTPKTMELRTGVTPIRGIHEKLYDVIRDTVKIPNGDESELWFAITYNGRVKGAVAGESGIEADIEVGDQTISLKNYEKTTFDFGSLPAEGTQLLNEFLEISKLLTGQDISKSKGRDQINNVLNFLDDETVEAQIRQLIEMGETTDIILIRNVGKRLKKFYALSDNLDSMIHAFCHIIDTVLQEKVLSVGWWGMIIKSNKTLFLESAEDVYQAVRCKNDRLSDAIANFHQNKLFVLGSQLSTKVTKKSQD